MSNAQPEERTRGSRYLSILIAVTFALLSLVPNLPSWPGNSSLIRQGDLTQLAWNLEWNTYAITHGHALFSTTYLNYPGGIDLAENLSALFLTIITLPITLFGNVVASVNFILWLAFFSSAWSMYFVMHRLLHSRLAAFVGGVIYAFSPYMINQGINHPVLNFIPIPPLVLYVLHQLFVVRSMHRYRLGAALGLLLLLQFYIEPEITASLVLISFLGLAILALAHRRLVIATVRATVAPLLVGAGVLFVGTAYPIYEMLRGPFHASGNPHPGGFSADLAGLVFPTSFVRFAPPSMKAIGDQLSTGNLPENGIYLGAPLIVLLLLVAWRCRSNRWIRFSMAMIAISIILALGNDLEIDNHVFHLWLPYSIINASPLLSYGLAIRIDLFEWLFVAIALAIAIREYLGSWQRRARVDKDHQGVGGTASSSTTRRAALVAVTAVLAVASLIALIPELPYPNTPSNVPAFFRSPALTRITPGSVTLVSPYPVCSVNAAELWQAVARMRFKLLGGYGMFADASGVNTSFPSVLQPADVLSYLWQSSSCGTPPPSVPPPPSPSPLLVHDFARFIAGNRVGTAIWVSGKLSLRSTGPVLQLSPTSRETLMQLAGVNPGVWSHTPDTLFRAVLGRPSITDQGVEVWLHATSRAQRFLQRATTGTT